MKDLLWKLIGGAFIALVNTAFIALVGGGELLIVFMVQWLAFSTLLLIIGSKQ